MVCRLTSSINTTKLYNAPQTPSWLGRGHPSPPLSPSSASSFPVGPRRCGCGNEDVKIGSIYLKPRQYDHRPILHNRGIHFTSETRFIFSQRSRLCHSVVSACLSVTYVLWLNGASCSKSYYWQHIGSRIWGIDWYWNQWPWPLFRCRLRSCQLLRQIRHRISWKTLEIEDKKIGSEGRLNGNLSMENRMVAWSTMSPCHVTRKVKLWPQKAERALYLKSSWSCYLATIDNYKSALRHAVILATAWFLVVLICRFCKYNYLGVPHHVAAATWPCSYLLVTKWCKNAHRPIQVKLSK